jgi:hypothetical protein
MSLHLDVRITVDSNVNMSLDLDDMHIDLTIDDDVHTSLSIDDNVHMGLAIDDSVYMGL